MKICPLRVTDEWVKTAVLGISKLMTDNFLCLCCIYSLHRSKSINSDVSIWIVKIYEFLLDNAKYVEREHGLDNLLNNLSIRRFIWEYYLI